MRQAVSQPASQPASHVPVGNGEVVSFFFPIPRKGTKVVAKIQADAELRRLLRSVLFDVSMTSPLKEARHTITSVVMNEDGCVCLGVGG